MTSVQGTELLYWVFALGGTLFFLFRVGAMIVGGFGSEDGATEGSVDGETLSHDADVADGDTAHHAHSLQATDPAFKLVSIHSLTGFFMTFGWAGLAGVRQLGWGSGVSFLFAFACGGAVMFATAWLLKMVGRLTSAGDVFVIAKTAGMRGSVYLRIPADGRGQVKLVVNNATRYLDAVSEDRVELASFVDVVVVRAVDAQTVSVRKA